MNDYLLRLRMRDRELEILKDCGVSDYRVRLRRGGSGFSKKIARQLRATLFRSKVIPDPRQRSQ